MKLNWDELHRPLTALVVAVVSIVILLVINLEQAAWLRDVVFAVIISVIFFAPLLLSIFDFELPMDFLVLFVIGLSIFIIYSIIFFSSMESAITLVLFAVLFTSITSLGHFISGYLEDILPW